MPVFLVRSSTVYFWGGEDEAYLLLERTQGCRYVFPTIVDTLPLSRCFVVAPFREIFEMIDRS